MLHFEVHESDTGEPWIAVRVEIDDEEYLFGEIDSEELEEAHALVQSWYAEPTDKRTPCEINRSVYLPAIRY